MRLLIVEDCDDVRENLADFLRDKGYQVDTASDGFAGLHRACDFQVDLAVIDCGLPGLTGIHLIEKIRGLKFDFPILVMTSYDSWVERTGLLEAGADDYIDKVFRFDALLGKLEGLLGKVALASRFDQALSSASSVPV